MCGTVHETWRRLRDAGLVGTLRHSDFDFDHYAMSSSLGLTIMAILAECCAGTRIGDLGHDFV